MDLRHLICRVPMWWWMGLAGVLILAFADSSTSLAEAARDSTRAAAESSGIAATTALDQATRGVASAARAAEKAQQDEAQAGTGTQFKGIDFGIGLGVTTYFDRTVIQKAEVVADTVRVTEDRRSIPRVLLESHYFVSAPLGRRLGLGPFLAIQTGGSDLIEAIGMGVMVGWHRQQIVAPVTAGSQAKVIDSSFNIAVGAVLDNNVLVLRDGVTKNAPLSPSNQASLTRTTSRWAFMLSISFSP